MPIVSVFLPPETVETIDRLRIREVPPPTRSAVLRELLMAALAQERKPPAPSKSRRGDRVAQT